MAETLFDISDTYRSLRRKNPIACGEWLLRIKEREGISQAQIAERLGANRQMIGRYLRMAQWSKQLKEMISQSQISNTELLRAASSPKNETALRRSIHKYTENISTPAEDKKEPPPPVAPVIPEIPHEPPPCPLPEKKEEVRSSSEEASELSWLVLLRFIIRPSTIFIGLSIAALDAFLIHQGIIFFSAVDANVSSAVSSSVFSELIPFLAAACFALSTSRFRQILSGLVLIASICGLAFFMHSSLAQRHVDSSQSIASLENERSSVLKMIDTLSESASALPSNFISRKQDIMKQIDTQRTHLAHISASIDLSVKDISSSANISLIYGAWLRIAAMILNAILVHALFAGLRRQYGL